MIAAKILEKIILRYHIVIIVGVNFADFTPRNNVIR